MVRDGEVQKRYADKLIQLWRLNGGPLLVMCHIEVLDYRSGWAVLEASENPFAIASALR